MSPTTIAVIDCKWSHVPVNGRWALALFTSLFLLIFSNMAGANSVTVGWTPTTDSRVTGYEIGYGITSTQYQWTSAARASGTATSSQVVDGLQPGTKYYFAVRSVGASSSEVSPYSREVSTTIPTSADTQAPTVTISSPSAGATYNTARTVAISATASDNVGVAKVEFYDGGTLKATTTSSHSYNWAISGNDNGAHGWTAKAYDAAGNATTSAAVSLSVNIAASDTTKPTVAITSPTSTDTPYTSARTLTINATAADNVGVAKVEFYDGGTLKATTTSSHSYNWAITGNDNGTHSWTAKAYDAAGNSSTSAAVSLSVNIPGTTVAGCAGSTLWPNSAVPKVLTDSDRGAVELGVKFRSDVDGYVCGVRFYKGPSNTGTHVGRLWTNDGALLAQATFTNETGSGWQQVNFATPVAVSAGSVYVASYHAPRGAYSVDDGYFTSKGVDAAPLHALRTGVSDGNGVYLYGSGGFPANSWNASNYWVDAVFTIGGGSVADTAAPNVSITSPSAGATYSTAGTVAISATASDNVGVAKVEFYDGGTLKATTTSSHSYNWAITGSDNGTHSWTARAYDAAGNATTSAAVSLNVKIPIPDTTKPTVAITAPTATSTPYTSARTVTIKAAAADNVGVAKVEFYDGGTLKATTTSSHSYNWSITGNDNGTHSWTVKAYDAAGNSSTSAAVSLSVNIPVAVAGCAGSTLWPNSAVPKVLTDSDRGAVELGVKFRSDVDGYVCGVRFYKGPSNTGTHVGRLWTNDGALLAQATFTNETGSGWQQVSFATPVAVSAGSVYVASYHAPRGAYSVDDGYFTSKGVDAAPLHALRTGVSGANGVYLYGAGGFPTNSWHDSNYWVDPVFTTGQSALAAKATETSMEAGEVNVDDQWTRVDFTQPFADPVVVAKPPSANDLDPVLVRIDRIDSDGFWIRLQGWDYLDGPRSPEQVGYLVMERGRHQLPDGAVVEAGSVEIGATGSFERIGFEDAFAEIPVVITSVTSVNEDDAVAVRGRGIDRDGFELGLSEQEANRQEHATESVDYIAWEASWGEIDGFQYEVGLTPESVDHVPYTFVYPAVMPEAPFVLADMQTTNGSDPASLRWRYKANDLVDLWVEEEQSGDAETGHVGEKIGYILIVPLN